MIGTARFLCEVPLKEERGRWARMGRVGVGGGLEGVEAGGGGSRWIYTLGIYVVVQSGRQTPMHLADDSTSLHQQGVLTTYKLGDKF